VLVAVDAAGLLVLLVVEGGAVLVGEVAVIPGRACPSLPGERPAAGSRGRRLAGVSCFGRLFILIVGVQVSKFCPGPDSNQTTDIKQGYGASHLQTIDSHPFIPERFNYIGHHSFGYINRYSTTLFGNDPYAVGLVG